VREYLEDTFCFTFGDGVTSVSQGFTVNITGVNDTAVITGTSTGAVTEDAAASLTTSGTLSVSDADTGQADFVAQASKAGTYGTFTLGTDGAWTYTASNTQTAIQELGAGDRH
jgi:hypothetical protein